ncbi:Protein SLENDER RICE1-LIKE 1 [Linum grandiflorum]
MRNCWEAIASPSPILAVIYEKIPFYQIRQLAGVQAIVESVEKAKRIHIIDLKIRNGMQWAALLQALASRKKITAIVTETEKEKSVVQTGERLARFAESMKIPFVFKTVAVHDMLEIRNKQFDIDPREVVAVFCENSLHELIQKPSQLEAFMGVIRNIRPKVMVVIEREANFNSLNFGQRFVEVLFHYGAYFDCIDACLGSDEEGNKMVMEEGLVREQVNDALVKEENVMTRTATIDVWRRFFGRFWMVEGRLSPMIMATVDLLLDRFSEGRSCTVDMNGSSLVVGWKGTPIFSLSTWKFLLVKPLKRSNKRVKLDTCDGDGVLGI